MPTGYRLSLPVHLLGDAELLVCSHPIRARHLLSEVGSERKSAATHRCTWRLSRSQADSPLSFCERKDRDRPRDEYPATSSKKRSARRWAMVGRLRGFVRILRIVVLSGRIALAHECSGQNLGSVCWSADCDLRIFRGRDVFVLVERERPGQGTSQNPIACGSQVKGEIRWRVGGSRFDTAFRCWPRC